MGCSDLTSFFFFQAEDGIRVLYVTGVQTCALPISARSTRTSVSGGNRVQFTLVGVHVALAVMLLAGAALLIRSFERSEERRVGKECRCGWSPTRQKKSAGLASGVGRCSTSTTLSTV